MARTFSPLTLLAGVVAFLLAGGLLSQTLYNRAHNEQMYVAAGYLLSQGERLYSDFAFVQMPYTPWTYALVNVISGGGDYLFKAKLVNYGWMILAAALLWSRARRAAGSDLAALLTVVFLANYYTLKATVEASNYTLPLALSLAAYLLLARGLEGRGRAWLMAGLAGVALGGAVGGQALLCGVGGPVGAGGAPPAGGNRLEPARHPAGAPIGGWDAAGARPGAGLCAA
jgi:uncharacterized membrane protein